MPLAGEIELRFAVGGASSENYRTVLLPADARLPMIPEGGLSLLDCLLSLPGMYDFVRQHDLDSRLIRGRLSVLEIEGPVPTATIQLIRAGSGKLNRAISGISA